MPRPDAAGLIDVPNVIPDGVVIPNKGIYGAYRDGDMHDKPMIFGSTRDEDKLFDPALSLFSAKSKESEPR